MRLVFAHPGALDLPTGGYAYDRRLIAGLRSLGWQVDTLRLPGDFPFPETLTGAEAALDALPDGTAVMIDGLAYGVLDAWAARNAQRLDITALVHHPLALEGGLPPATEAALRGSETRALAHARRVIVTSPQTGRDLAASFGIENAIVALPGTDPAPRATGSTPPLILSVGTLIPRKGHDTLLDALEMLTDLNWTCIIAGSPHLDPTTAAKLHARATPRIQFVGEVADIRALMATADIFALASRYEGYGMVFAEAMAQGLPIVACHAGAIPEVVPDTAGILVPPDDAEALATALRILLIEPAYRATLAAGAEAAGAALPSWDDTARQIAKALT